jgi:hypothetical protein
VPLDLARVLDVALLDEDLLEAAEVALPPRESVLGGELVDDGQPPLLRLLVHLLGPRRAG